MAVSRWNEAHLAAARGATLPVFLAACGRLVKTWPGEYQPPNPRDVGEAMRVVRREMASGRGGVPALPSGVRPLSREEARACVERSYEGDTAFAEARRQRRALRERAGT